MQQLVIGAGSAIAKALIQQYLNQGDSIVAVSRQAGGLEETSAGSRLQRLQCDYTESSIDAVCAELRESGVGFDRVTICNGILHHEGLSPEKRLENASIAPLESVMRINAFVPLLWVKALKPLLKVNRKPCVITALSARVGSIGDNERGGWYAYRASKAALNMLLKTAALEYRREVKLVQFLLFHPGTTDSPLSKPFQKNISPTKLFTPEFVASQLMRLQGELKPDLPIQFLDWQGKRVEW